MSFSTKIRGFGGGGWGLLYADGVNEMILAAAGWSDILHTNRLSY